jgi:hypothetical protein
MVDDNLGVSVSVPSEHCTNSAKISMLLGGDRRSDGHVDIATGTTARAPASHQRAVCGTAGAAGAAAAAGRTGASRRATWPCGGARAQVVALVALGTLSGIDFAGTSPVMPPRSRTQSGAAQILDHGRRRMKLYERDLLAPSHLRDEPALQKPIITVRGEQQPGAGVVRSAIGISIEMARPEGVLADTTIYYTLSSEGENLRPSCGTAEVLPSQRAGEKYETPIHFCGQDSAVTIRAILCPQPGSAATAKILKSQYTVPS